MKTFEIEINFTVATLGSPVQDFGQGSELLEFVRHDIREWAKRNNYTIGSIGVTSRTERDQGADQ